MRAERKICAACGVSKPLTEFYIRGTGRQSRCIECDKLRASNKATPNRQKQDMCGTCCNLHHRVEGKRCPECGREYREEPLPERSNGWSATEDIFRSELWS